MNLAQKINRIRSIKGITQAEMAEKLNISQKAYSNLENNKTKIDEDRLSNIAEAFKMEASEIRAFDEKQIFIKCTQSGNIGVLNHKNFKKERKAHQQTIAILKKDKEQLQNENKKLIVLIEKLTLNN